MRVCVDVDVGVGVKGVKKNEGAPVRPSFVPFILDSQLFPSPLSTLYERTILQLPYFLFILLP